MSSSRSTTARRAVVRWSWRLFRREWRAQLIVLCLATVAVAAAIVGSTMAVRATSDTAGEFGNARAVIQLFSEDPAATVATAVALTSTYDGAERIDHQRWTVPGSTAAIDARSFDPGQHLVAPMIGLLDGRYPEATGEVALTHRVATLLDVRLGGTVTLAGADRTVTGIVENPRRLSDEFALVPPGSITAPAVVDVFVTEFSGLHGAQADNVQVGVMDRSDQGGARVVLVALVIAVAMVLVGLVAAAGFLVVAQRRQRQLGLLAAIGATRQHLRMVMLANGAIVGAVAAVLGTVLGVAGWNLVLPVVRSTADRQLGRLDLAWSAVVLIAALSVSTSTLAAWWPARTASRVPVMTALSGRPPQLRPVRRPIFVAVVVLAAGMGAIVASGVTRPNPKPLLLVVGLLAVVFGNILASPGAIRLAAVPARWAPLATRLALRDLARYRARASAALAAVTLGLGIAAGVVVIAGASASREQDAANLPADEVLVHAGGDSRQLAGPPTADTATLDAAAATVVTAFGDGATTLPLDVAVTGSSARPLTIGVRADPQSLEFIGPAYVATPELLAHYGIAATSIPAGADAITSRADDVVVVEQGGGRDAGTGPPAIRVAGLPHDSSEPTALVTQSAMQRLDWQPRRSAWLVTLPDAPTTQQLDAARAAAARAGYAIETREQPASPASLQDWATIIGIVLALLIIVMSIGLLRSESAGDVRTLAANGAPARVRRSIAASTAGTLALLGAVLGILGAYLAAISAFHADLGRLHPVPFAQLLGVLVGLPLLAAALAWLAAGRQPPTISRRTLD